MPFMEQQQIWDRFVETATKVKENGAVNMLIVMPFGEEATYIYPGCQGCPFPHWGMNGAAMTMLGCPSDPLAGKPELYAEGKILATAYGTEEEGSVAPTSYAAAAANSALQNVTFGTWSTADRGFGCSVRYLLSIK